MSIVARIPADWHMVDHYLRREWVFDDFVDAMVFVNQVAQLAEEHEHHPDIDIRYNKVVIATTTHDAGFTVTEKDVRLAEAINLFGAS
jgi:4a-hydroxytetrahydrobiopterin dehydratase